MSNVINGGGGFYKLAPDLNRISEQKVTGDAYKEIDNIDARGALTTVINLSGKWLLTNAFIYGAGNQVVTLKVTVDNIVIINDTFTVQNFRTGIVGVQGSMTNQISDTYLYCDSNILIEFQTATDDSVLFQYNARPIA